MAKTAARFDNHRLIDDHSEIAKSRDQIEQDETFIPEAHRQYLLRRHGTLYLDPIPNMDDDDPYNWPSWKKVTNLVLVAFHGMMAAFTAAALQPAFVDISIDLNVSIVRASYLTSLCIIVIGGAPLIWQPLSSRYGRRPVFIMSLIFSLVGNIGCAKSPSYATMALCRAITAFFICPASSIGSGVVAETFFRKDRARCMGVWTLMFTLGVALAPLFMGLVAYRIGYRWIYYILAIINAVQLVLYLFLGPETLYMRNVPPSVIDNSNTAFKKQYLTVARIDPTPITWKDFVEPFTLAFRSSVLIPAVTYSMTFCLAGILPALEIPQIFPLKFHLNTEQVGLQYVSLIIGSVVGEQLGGILSDQWMLRRYRKLGEFPPFEFRLWLSYPGYVLAICGLVVFLLQTQNATNHWNVTPLVGIAIAAAGYQIVATVNVTYAVDCYRDKAASVGVFIVFVRQTWGFIGPFWFPHMIGSVGFSGSAGITTGLIVAFGILPTFWIHWKGHRMH